MGRKPINKAAMTPAERQKRRRARLRKERARAGTEADRKKARAKAADAYIPAPPGITHWQQHTVLTPEGERQVWSPTTKPAAAVHLSSLSDEEIAGLIEQLAAEAERRRASITLGAVLAEAPHGGAL